MPPPGFRRRATVPHAVRSGWRDTGGDLRGFLALAFMLCLAGGLAISLTRPAAVDEAWFANPALTLLAGDGMRTPIMAETDFASRSMSSHTYWQPPGYFVIQAAWYSVVGFSLLSQRLLSLLFAPMLLALAWLLGNRLKVGPEAAGVGVILMSTSIPLIASASSGRMDILTAVFGWAGLLATLLSLDHGRLRLLLLGSACIAVSGMLHPNGMIYFVTAAVLLLAERPPWLRPSAIALALVPYAVAALAWGLYILQDVPAFRAQFFGNMRGYAPNFPNIFAAFWREAVLRYWRFFGVSFDVSAARVAITVMTKGVLLVATVGSVAGVLRTSRRGFTTADRRLLLLVIVPVLGLALLPRNKTPTYFVYVVPAFTLALMSAYDWLRSAGRARVAVAVASVMMAAQLVWAAHLVRVYGAQNTAFQALGACLKAEAPDAEIYGSSEIAYLVGFGGRMRDDLHALGSGTPRSSAPRFLVVGERYRLGIMTLSKSHPERALANQREMESYPFRYSFGADVLHASRPLARCGPALPAG